MPYETYESQLLLSMRRERGALSRILDACFTFVLFGLIALLCLRGRLCAPALWLAAIFFAGIALALRTQLCDWRLRRRAQKKCRETVERARLESLCLLSNDRAGALCAFAAGEKGYRALRSLPPGAGGSYLIAAAREGRVLVGLLQRHMDARIQPQEVLEFHRMACAQGAGRGVLLATTTFSEECAAFIRREQLAITCVSSREVLRFASECNVLPGEKQIEAALLRALRGEQARKKRAWSKFPVCLLQPALAKRYGVVGLTLLGCGLLFGMRLYYSLCAWGCFALSAACIALPRLRREATRE